jgi:hypothetical protein
MQLQTAHGAGHWQRRRYAGTLPALWEFLLVAAAIAILLPEFDHVAGFGAGRDQRYADPGVQVAALPDPALPGLCARYAALAEADVRRQLCGSIEGDPTASLAQLPPELSLTLSRAASAFLAPVKDAQARLTELRLRQREGFDGVREVADAIAAVEGGIQPFIERFRIAGTDASAPLALQCAERWADAVFAGSPGSGLADTGPMVPRANAVLLLAAALDGRAAVESVAGAAALPAPTVRPAPGCELGGVATLSAAAALMADARQSAANARKNEAMRMLLRSAGWQWAGAMLLGYGLMVWSRRARSSTLGVALSLALWTVAAWVVRVPWPLAGSREFEPVRVDPSLWSPPSTALAWLGAIAALLFVAAALVRPKGAATRPRPQAMSSRAGYAGLVLSTGLGWLLLLDLSANAHAGNRYLALYHQGHLWLGMLILSVVMFLRQPLSQRLGKLLASAGETARRFQSRLGPARVIAAGVLLAVAALLAFGLTLSNMRQLTSELGRLWLIVGAAWFFFMRGGPLAERLARSGTTGTSFWRYVGPLLWVVGVLIAAMFVTRDMGPLLIAGYASGAFLAASVAMWWQQRTGTGGWGSALSIALFCLWIGLITAALFEFGSVDSVTSARLDSMAAPFASTNDQLALIAWFQRATPPDGFGLGAVPWCGHAPLGGCKGVPAQIHSD